MATLKAAIPKGTRDFLPEQMRQRYRVMDTIRRVYERHGFSPIETPAIENIETLMGKYGEEGDQLLFKILMRGAKAASGQCDLGLRYDLTVPLSRFVAMHQNEIGRVFKRYQIQPVYRADRPGHGRFREFYQCDIDMIGAAAPMPEIALLQAVSDVFAELKFDALCIHLNDRRILRALIEVCGISVEQETTAITAIDKLDKIGVEGVQKELMERGIAEESAHRLLELIQARDSNEETLNALESLFADKSEALQAVSELRLIVGASHHFANTPQIRVSPELARGLNYYTGAIFEIQAEGLNSSIAGGGRYDHLIGMFSGRDIPAVGISLGFERICVIMQERGMFDDVQSDVDVVVAPAFSGALHAAIAFSSQVRSLGLSCEIYPGFDKLAKQFKYANERHARYVAVFGEDEIAAGTVTLKDMESGEQKTALISMLCLDGNRLRLENT
ncbi:MAG: histidine--tRNA ligase [Proteobacteria bacterium]|nr:histidine--tRNA ligase [Pseudomonadota bacterium]